MKRALVVLTLTAILAVSFGSAPLHARRLSPRNAWNRLAVASGPIKAWNRLAGLSYRYLVHAYSPSGRLLWQRTESHLLRRHPDGLELRVQYRDRQGRKWVVVTGPRRRWATCDEAPREWKDLDAEFRRRLAVDLFVLDHPFCLRRKGTAVRHVGLGRVRGRDCQSFDVVYPRVADPFTERARIDALSPEGWLHRIRFLSAEGNGEVWNVHLDQHLRHGAFRIPMRREMQIDGVRWRKTVMTDMVLNGRFSDDLFRRPGHPLR